MGAKQTELTCPVCGTSGARPFLSRPGLPVHQNLVLPSQATARAIGRGDVELAVCLACEFVFNAAFDAAKLGYGEDYDNTQTHSPYFQAHVDGLVEHLVNERGVRDSRIVEVGCGKGGFVRQLVAYAGAGNTGVGFDPTYLGPLEDLDGRLRFERTFYGPDQADQPADVVVCRHVIEHVADPVALLRDIRLALAHSPKAKVYFETPCVAWILRERVVWDFFYEHCSLFTRGSLGRAFEAAGFAVDGVRHVFGGQYLWIEAHLGTTLAPPQPEDVPALALAFADAERALVADLKAQLAAAVARGPVALWGAGAKGVTLANLVDAEARAIACVVDVNPNKQGRFIAGTGHPIVAPTALVALQPATIFLLNPNYRPEIQATLANLGLGDTALRDL